MMKNTEPTIIQIKAAQNHSSRTMMTLVERHFTKSGLIINEYAHGHLVAFDSNGNRIGDRGI